MSASGLEALAAHGAEFGPKSAVRQLQESDIAFANLSVATYVGFLSDCRWMTDSTIGTFL
jgi:hypothetical protein